MAVPRPSLRPWAEEEGSAGRGGTASPHPSIVGRVDKREEAAAAVKPWHQTRQRPLVIGASIGHRAVTAGTLGGFFHHEASGKTVILSNNHVLADEDRGKVGDTVVQPGAYDGGKPRRDKVGTLLAAVALQTTGNLVDAAIAAILSTIDHEMWTIRALGRLATTVAPALEPDDRVAKLGRTTGLTRGMVTAVELDDVVVTYDQGNLSFKGQIEIETTDAVAPFSRGGDSGSLIVDAERRPAALLFAGSDQGGANGLGLTYANPIGAVLHSLGLRMAS